VPGAYRVFIVGKAEKELAKLPKEIKRRVERHFDALATDPLRPRPGADIKRLREVTGQYRLRVGEYRVFYKVVGDAVTIVAVKHRRHAYE
jgi:mRNA-degrading endonuclease RelE of RelBE toxin-antitoxin system